MSDGEILACTIWSPRSGGDRHQLATVAGHEPSAAVVLLTVVVEGEETSVVQARICMRCGQVYIPTT